MNDSFRVRFAPSPTGELHIGNVRTALFNWLFSRKKSGKMILRIEDTDQERTAKLFEQNLLDDLAWLGIDWDEGPDYGGPYGPYNQMQRLPLYGIQLERLLTEGRAYPCYCSEEELEAERNLLISKNMMPRYSGKCRNLPQDERRRLESQARIPAYRFAVPEAIVEFNDMIRGHMKFDAASIGDFIIVRSNGLPAYNFAVVVDDHLMKISHVIRGEDHLSNTASQLLLYHALGFEPPVFAHHSLILGKDRTKLSKRHGAVSVGEFRKKGILPEVLLNYLALMGNSFGKGKEACTMEEILRFFALEKTGKSGAIFDENKLEWLNAIHIRNVSLDRLAALVLPFVKEAGYENLASDLEKLRIILTAVRANINTLAEIKNYLPIFSDDKCYISPDALDCLKEADALRVVSLFHELLLSDDIPEKGFYEKVIKRVSALSGAKGRGLYLPLRCALTGMISGPELNPVIDALGRAAVVKRLYNAIKLASNTRH